MDEWVDGWVGGWIGRWVGRWMDGCLISADMSQELVSSYENQVIPNS